MERAHGLAAMGLALDAPYLGPWADKIGRFILNFGSIELVSYQHLLLLEATNDGFLLNIGSKFGRRVDRIKGLLAASSKLSEGERDASINRWDEANEFAKWRNRIAHNPVLPTWHPGSDADKDPPDLLGIPDVRQLKKGMISDSISMELITKMVDHSAGLGQRLHEVSAWLRRDV